MAMSWMENYFALNAEVLPTSGKMHLMDNYTRYEVFMLYKEGMLGAMNSLLAIVISVDYGRTSLIM